MPTLWRCCVPITARTSGPQTWPIRLPARVFDGLVADGCEHAKAYGIPAEFSQSNALLAGVYREWQQRYIPLQNAYGYVYGDKTNNKGFMSRTNSM